MRKIIICTCNTSTKHTIRCKSVGIKFLEMPFGRKYSVETVLSA